MQVSQKRAIIFSKAQFYLETMSEKKPQQRHKICKVAKK